MRTDDYERLASETTHVIHCAAAVRFDLELEEARRENVGGTRNVLEFGRACGNLRRLDYVGTAYVAGKRTGLVREDELDEGQQHNNTYEKTKMEAEKLVRGSVPGLPVAILRPSIVICDSKTGRATNHNGFYRALSMYWRDALKVLPGDPEARLDLVPVDYVAAAAYSIASTGASTGQCYHLAAGPDASVRLAELQDLTSFHFAKKRFQIIPPEEFRSLVAARRPAMTEEERDMMDEVLLYLPYLAGEPAFDTSNARRATGLTVPRVESYFKTMADYVMRH
jgi:long-chain acyl-CoA synthetase